MSWRRFLGLQERATYARTSGDMLLNDTPAIWWMGYDSGGGAYPIGPNGPHGVKVLPAVTRLTSLITDPLSTVPWAITSTDAAGSASSSMPPRWISDPQLLRPDARFPAPTLPAVRRLPRSAFWGSWIRSAVWHGAGHIAFAEDEAGQPLAGTLRHLDSRLVSPVRDELGVVVWEIGEGPEAARTDRDGYLDFEAGPRWRIATLRDPHAPIDSEGRSISVFERHADTFGLSGSLENYARGVFTSGIPSGFLKVNTPGLQQEEADELKRKWMEAHGGDRRSVAVLNASTDYTALTFSPVDAALIETKRANLADLALAFSLDPSGALGVTLGNSATYSNVQQHFARLRQDLLPWITAVEQTIGALLPAGREIRLDFTDLTRPDPKEQYEGLKVALDAGILTIDEARAVLGLPPTPPPLERAPVRPLAVAPSPDDETDDDELEETGT